MCVAYVCMPKTKQTMIKMKKMEMKQKDIHPEKCFGLASTSLNNRTKKKHETIQYICPTLFPIQSTFIKF